MIKLNNKGYLTIEIILAAVVAFAIAFFLIELTIKLVNKTDDYYMDTLFINDKALIMKNIKNSIEKDIKTKGKITDIYNNCTLKFTDESTKQIAINNTNRTIKYGDYIKKINDSIKGNITIKQCEIKNGYIVIQINIDDIFVDESRDINIVTYNGINDSSDSGGSTTVDDTGGESTTYTVSVIVDGDNKGNATVASGKSHTFTIQANAANHLYFKNCEDNETGSEFNTANLVLINSASISFTVDNVTSNTTCYIEYK